MRLNRRDERGVVILELSEAIEIGDDTAHLIRAVRDGLEEGATKFLLDLTDVTTVDEAGLHAIVKAGTAVAREKGQVVLVGVAPPLADILTITKVIGMFHTYANQADALEALEPSGSSSAVD